MVIISGQVPTAAIGQDAFQEVDTVGITRPCVKHNMLVKDVREIAPAIKKAFHIASNRPSRPGAGGYSQRHHCAALRVRISGLHQHAFVQPGFQGASRPDQEGSTIAAGSQAPDDLRRWWCRAVQCRGKTHQAGPFAWRSVYQYPDGAGRVPCV